MFDFKRIIIGFCILLAAYYIVGLCSFNMIIDLVFVSFVLLMTILFAFKDKNDNVIKEDEES